MQRCDTARHLRERLAPLRAFAALVFFLLSSARVPAQTRPAHFTDEIGRQVDVPAEVRRIVSLAPNLTEIVFAMGEGERLVGDTTFCDYPAEATQKTHVGGPINPNFEQIAAVAPDLILATKAINRRETVDALARLGLPVYVTDPHSVEDMVSSIEHLGGVLHAEASAAALAKELRARLSELDRVLAGVAPRRVFFVVWTTPLISVGRGTFIADALRRAGARSVVEAASDWPQVSLEQVVLLEPGFLVFASAHAAETRQEIEDLRAQPGWRDLDALRRGNAIVLSDAINRPAPRLVDAIEQLARALHPEVFAAHGAQADLVRAAEEVCPCAP
jgi:cobalamin transport system substrate-binding protein